MQAHHFPPSHTFDGALALTNLGLIRAQGPDAAAFLHGQLSQDVLGLDASHARLAAFCSPKGRMQASFILSAPAPETIDLLTDRAVLPAVLKRLSMFVLRSKLRLSDESEQRVMLGLCGASARERLQGEGLLPTQTWQSLSAASGAQVIALPEAHGVSRWLWLGTPEQAQALSAGLPVLSATQWDWLEVMSGVARVEPATVDQFVPQMVNYELVGGVNFSKGCYPGQEVVARSQYRGTLKRRALLFHAQASMQAGQEVFVASDPGQPAGQVANAAPIPGPDGQPTEAWTALIEAKWQLLDQDWRLGSAEGPALAQGSMPYEVPLGAAD